MTYELMRFTIVQIKNLILTYVLQQMLTKGIESLPQTLLLKSLYLCDRISDISVHENSFRSNVYIIAVQKFKIECLQH